MNAFDNEKLQAEIELRKYDVQPTQDFIMAELERCKDPLYFYNHYWSVNGKAVKPMTREEWDAKLSNYNKYRIYPLIPKESFKP